MIARPPPSLLPLLLLLLLGVTTSDEVLYVPLDERYATRGLTLNLARLISSSPDNFVTPPTSLLPRRKHFADPDAVLEWLESRASNASAAIVSAEMVLYGGLIASRSSNETLSIVLSRLDRLLKIPRLYLSTVVMRIPSYNGDFEEPWYWATHGRDLYEYSYHKGRYDALGDANDRAQYLRLKASIPKVVLHQFLWRRERNHNVTASLLAQCKDAARAVYVNLDDSGQYGLNVEEAQSLRNEVQRLSLSSLVRTIPFFFLCPRFHVSLSLSCSLILSLSVSFFYFFFYYMS